MKEISALLAGLLFSLGLIISGMTDPQNIKNFLDISGEWDPALAFVLLVAVIVTGVGYRLAWKRSKPLYDKSFSVPTSRVIDKRLILGAIIFGIGWGLVGLCPGPALASLFTSNWLSILIFIGAMIGGILLQRRASPLLG